MAKSKSKIKWDRVIIITLAIIGFLTVLDNSYRLVREVGNTIVHHRWNMVVVK
jgi:hypothetical protein